MSDRNERDELSAEINCEGRWEEFYQKNENYFMYDFHKQRRLKLIEEFKKRFSSSKL